MRVVNYKCTITNSEIYSKIYSRIHQEPEESARIHENPQDPKESVESLESKNPGSAFSPLDVPVKCRQDSIGILTVI